MPTQYTKMIDNNGQIINVENDRVNRFLSEGWTLVDQPKEEKKSQAKSSKKKITADAQVTSSNETLEEEIQAEHCENCGGEHDYKDCDEDNWTYSEDDFGTAKKED